MYKDHLIDTILESGLPDEVQTECIVALESADSTEELNSIGLIIEETAELYNSGSIDDDGALDIISCLTEEVKTDDLTLKEQQDASGATTAKDDGNNTDDNESDISWTDKVSKTLDEAVDKLGTNLGEGANKVNSWAKDFKGKVKSALSSVSSDDKKSITSEIDSLDEDVKNLMDECDSDDTTGSKAKTLGNKVKVKAKLIMKKLRTALGSKKTVNESAYTDEDVLEALYEASEAGSMTDDDVLLITEAMSLGKKYGDWKNSVSMKAGDKAVNKLKAKSSAPVDSQTETDTYVNAAEKKDKQIKRAEAIGTIGAAIAIGKIGGMIAGEVDKANLKKIQASDNPEVKKILADMVEITKKYMPQIQEIKNSDDKTKAIKAKVLEKKHNAEVRPLMNKALAILKAEKKSGKKEEDKAE